MNTERKLFEITAGPCKDMMFDACKYAYSKTAQIPIDFTVIVGYTRPKDTPGAASIPIKIGDIKIASIQHEDGSGESFNLEGFCKASINDDYRAYSFEAYYDTRSRKGVISFND